MGCGVFSFGVTALAMAMMAVGGLWSREDLSVEAAGPIAIVAVGSGVLWALLGVWLEQFRSVRRARLLTAITGLLGVVVGWLVGYALVDQDPSLVQGIGFGFAFALLYVIGFAVTALVLWLALRGEGTNPPPAG